MDAGYRQLRKICSLLQSVPPHAWQLTPREQAGRSGKSHLITTVNSLEFDLYLGISRSGTLDQLYDYNAGLSVTDATTRQDVVFYLENQHKVEAARSCRYELELTRGVPSDTVLHESKDILQRSRREPVAGPLYSLHRQKREEVEEQQRKNEMRVVAARVAAGQKKLEKLLRA